MRDLAQQLMVGDRLASSEWPDSIFDRTGFYAIFIDDASAVPAPFCDVLRKRETDLIYVGIAPTSLATRLLKQDLRHQGHSTFFRSLGAVLGYRPVPGSLAAAKKKQNYVFAPDDTAALRLWVAQHLSVRVVEEVSPASADEQRAIAELCPLLNLRHNPQKLRELELLRSECRRTASGA
ncbi:MAG: GIY-YIG nuclease family protein [Coriobacteriia bacterium]